MAGASEYFAGRGSMSGDTDLVSLYGLRVRSEIPLHQERWLPGGSADVVVSWDGVMPACDDAPAGRIFTRLELDRLYYTFAQADDGGYVLRFHGTCDVLIDAGLQDVRIRMVEGVDPELAGVLVAGAVLSFILTMRGATVLHASAVQVGGFAIGFVGSSGMGKSTVASLMCAAGALLITDDVLRLDLDGSLLRCRLGATELRLRKAAVDLAARFPGAPRARRTGDGRDALRAEAAVRDSLPVAGLVVPVPDRAHTSVRIERMSASEALVLLLRFPRLLGWADPSVLDRQFHQVGDVVERVPVFLARVPWGPPFPDGIADAIIEAVGESAPENTSSTVRGRQDSRMT